MKPHSADPHLGKALAHAPDRDAAPPAHLSAQILAAAHREAAAQPVRPQRPAPPWWRRPWGASGALATVVMAGFIGLLWRGEPPGPAVEGDGPSKSVATVAVPAVEPTAAQPVAAADAPPAAPAPVKPLVAATAAKPAARARVAEVKEEAAAAPTPPAAAVVAQVPVPVPVPAPSPAPAPPPAAAPAPPPMPTALPAPAAPSSKVAADRAESATTVNMAPQAPRTASMRVAPPTLAMGLRQGPLPGTPSAAPAAAALPDWMPNDHLRWDEASDRPLPDAAWLQQLAQLTQGRWSVAQAVPAGIALRWERSGATLGVLHWSGGTVWWCAAGQACLRAEPPADAWRGPAGEPASGR